ncbi:MAG: helix-turn-helix domain-containing protein [Beduini sp.]
MICNIASGLDIVPSEIFNEDYQEILCQHEEKRQVELLMNSDQYYLIDKKKVIRLLKKYRVKEGISQKILSIRTDVSRDLINNFEYGRGKVKPKLIIGLADLYHISMDEL